MSEAALLDSPPKPLRPKRQGRQAAYSQACQLQDRIAQIIRQPELSPSALAQLAEQWLKLETYKLEVRPILRPKTVVSDAIAKRIESAAASHFTEPDDDAPPTTGPAKV